MPNVKQGCLAIVLLLAGLLHPPLYAEPTNTQQPQPPTAQQGGAVTVPLADYQRLLALSQQQDKPSPTQAALSSAEIDVTVSDNEQRLSAEVNVRFSAHVFENQWFNIPLFHNNLAITSATVHFRGKSRPMELLQDNRGISWSTQQAGNYIFSISYQLDAQRTDTGAQLELPLPPTPASQLNALLPGKELQVAIIGGEGMSSQQEGENTRVQAKLAAMKGVQIAWQTGAEDSHLISRALYRGELLQQATKPAFKWQVSYTVQVFDKQLHWLPLISTDNSLSQAQVNQKNANIRARNQRFEVLLQGAGKHTINLTFWQSLAPEQTSQVSLSLPPVPVSEVQLTLPGNKILTSLPATHIQHSHSDNTTEALLFLPLAERATFQWSEAVPTVIEEEFRAAGSLYHLVHAEEGVLYGLVGVNIEINRGSTTSLQLQVPKDVEITGVSAANATIADWQVEAAVDQQRLTIFFKQAIDRLTGLEILYEQLFPSDQQQLDVPLLRLEQVQRQRGMVALLAGKELALKPIAQQHLGQVGENQLPVHLRQRIDKTVAHTYKYRDADSQLTVQTITPERIQGKFDASINTLVSIGDVNLTGQATLLLNVKTGSLMDLQLQLPADVNVLSLSAPSLRQQTLAAVEKEAKNTDKQTIQVEFTREMTGQFRLELTYERILQNSSSTLQVPTVEVIGAEVEHGQIAVEALAAVEVQAAKVERLSSQDTSALPHQLLQKTTNPILLAYRYVRSETPYLLQLQVTRHQELDVQVANIDSAHYRTLLTRDGVSVTTAQLQLRNSRKQFVRLQLPPHSEVWSVKVDQKTEKPAVTEHPDTGERTVLIRLINSRRGFPLQIVYTTPTDKLDIQGRFALQLPEPDLVVTNTQWDLFLPDDFTYQVDDTNLRQADSPVLYPVDLAQQAADASSVIAIEVPQQGKQLSFSKLYANQTGDTAYMKVSYQSPGFDRLAVWFSALVALLMGGGIILLIHQPQLNRLWLLSIPLLAGLWVGLIGYTSISAIPSLIVMGICLLLAGYVGQRKT